MGEKYVVKEGDSLSKIGQERWKEIYRENRSKIGEDPNLIKPGQELTVPAEIPEVPETPEIPSAPVTDEYVAVDPYQCMLQSCEMSSCDVADTFYMPSYWKTPIDIEANSINSIALDYLVPTGISESAKLFFDQAYETFLGNNTNAAIFAMEKLDERAKRGELSVKELSLAGEHDRYGVKKIAVSNQATPNDVLFTLANETSLLGDTTTIAFLAIKQLDERAKRGELSVKELSLAAEHDCYDVKEIAASNQATPNDVLFTLANETSLLGDTTTIAFLAIKQLDERAKRGELSVKELSLAAEHDCYEVKEIAASNQATPNDVLFTLANDTFLGNQTTVAILAVKNLKEKAKQDKLSAQDLKRAAEHERVVVREIAAIQIASRQ